MHPRPSRSAVRGPAGLAIVSLVIAACGAGASQAPSVAPTTATTTPTENVTAAPTPTPIPPGQVTGSLDVLDWSGYDNPDFWTDFKKTYPKVNVAFEFGTSDADIFGKVKAAPTQYDIFHPYTGWLQRYVDEGLVAEIDTSKLTNWSKVPDSFKKIGQVNGKQYFVPWDWGFTSILYRTDKVPSVDSWSALFDQAYKGHISMWDDGPGAVSVSAYIHGWDETQITDAQLAQIKQEWINQAKLNFAYWAAESDLVPNVQSGDVWLAYAWQGAYATLLGKKVPVAYANPKEGRNSWVGVYGIRKDDPNYDLALKFLDEKLGEATGQNLVNEYYYGTTNQDVMNGITDPTLKTAFSINDPTILQHTNFTPNVTAAQADAWTTMWAEVKASQ